MAHAVRKIRENVVNGVNIDHLAETIQSIKANPELARFKFRASTKWLGGAQTETRIQGFYGAGREDSSRRKAFILEADEPHSLLGANHGPSALETFLHSIASSLAAGFAYRAASENVRIDSLDFKVEGEIDLRGFLGVSSAIRPGYRSIRVTYKVRCDAPKEKVVEICDYVQKTSPLLDMLRFPVSFSVEMEG
ncbi:MAG: OsmC family protein [Deltaproteobacteria bacterium]|nr:OsmC family protein [Deltaproteobacteria bacterium]